jgi:hypothetical protein
MSQTAPARPDAPVTEEHLHFVSINSGLSSKRIAQNYANALRDARLAQEQFVAEHIKGAAMDGCMCEPCVSVRDVVARVNAALSDPAEPATNMKVSVEPPICQKHGTPMTLTFYERPGGPPGNGWSCRLCTAERSEPAKEDR